jgi:hypothetical protein
MKINENCCNTTVKFSSLSKGDVFKCADNGAYYMKTETVMDMENRTCVAVCLNDGMMVVIRPTDMVHVVDCELTVK